MTGTDWQTHAACAGVDTETFYTADDFTHPELTRSERFKLSDERSLRAGLICSTCTVRPQCLAYGIQSDRQSDYKHGTFGGLSPAERTQLAVRPVADVTSLEPRYFPPEVRTAVNDFRRGSSLSEASGRNGVSERQVRECARYLSA